MPIQILDAVALSATLLCWEAKAQPCECPRLSSRVLMAPAHLSFLAFSIHVLLGSGWRFPVRDVDRTWYD